MYLPERSISLKPEDNGVPIPSPADSLYHHPSRDSRDSQGWKETLAPLERRGRVFTVSMINLLLLLLSKVRDGLRLWNISYTMLYYPHVSNAAAATADDVAAAADNDRLVIHVPKVQPAIASSHMSGCDHRGKVCFFTYASFKILSLHLRLGVQWFTRRYLLV